MGARVGIIWPGKPTLGFSDYSGILERNFGTIPYQPYPAKMVLWKLSKKCCPVGTYPPRFPLMDYSWGLLLIVIMIDLSIRQEKSNPSNRPLLKF